MPENFGHATFDAGERDANGFPVLRHEPLTKEVAEALWESAKRAEQDCAERIPDEPAAIRAMFDGWQRLKELGWRDGKYAPRDGSRFRTIEVGSTGIFDGDCTGEWPHCTWTTYDEHDAYPSSQAPALFKLSAEDQMKYDAKMEGAKARYHAKQEPAPISETPMERSAGNRKYLREEDCEDNDEGA